MNTQVCYPVTTSNEHTIRALDYYEKRKDYQKRYYNKMKESRQEVVRTTNTIQDLENVIAQKETINQHVAFISKQKDSNIKQLQNIINELQAKVQVLQTRDHTLSFYEKLIIEYNTRRPQEFVNFITELKQLQLQPPEFHQQIQNLI